MAVPSHLLSPNRTLSFTRITPPSPSLSRTSSLFRPQPNLRSHLHLLCASIRKLSEVESIPIPRDPEQQLDERIPVGAGVYGVYDSNGALHYIGTSQCISNSIKKHRRLVPGMCYSVKVGPTGKGKPKSDALRNAFNAWIGEHMSSTGGRIPPGNESKSHIWSAPPRTLLLESEHLGLTESLDQLLKKQHMVAFIHGPPRKVFVGGKFVGGEEIIWKLAARGKLHTLC
ncbi:monothiol glutaredoxin-S12 [Carex littledalei]|uniref:Monothiol glutaredoxin-S12 n=1 Tax=Carex littledalei TaxID=544730 RepID=A0A833R032_9POAL|nr:monothiol glutaredoxin-S12 [Carex littledalei]